MDGRENFYQRLLNDAGVKKELGGGNIPEIVGRIKIEIQNLFLKGCFLTLLTHFRPKKCNKATVTLFKALTALKVRDQKSLF